jgi:hypothetical protein
MPKTAPKLGGTEMDLEKQIEDELLDLKLEMDTSNFGQKAIEEDKKRQLLKSKAKSTKSSKKSDPPPEDPVEEPADEEPEEVNMFTKP